MDFDKDSIKQKTFIESLCDGKYSMYAVVTSTMAGINIYAGGGEKDHIGSVAVSVPRDSLTGSGEVSCTTSVYNLTSHKDDVIAVKIAEEVCKITNQVTVVSAGFHINNAEKQELLRVIENTNKITQLIISRHKQHTGKK